MKSPITTHILDTSLGKPASGVQVALYKNDAQPSLIARAITDDDGRIANFDFGSFRFDQGHYCLCFEIQPYFDKQKITSFYSDVSINFIVADAHQHYHVPLLLNPFGYSTYRGS